MEQVKIRYIKKIKRNKAAPLEYLLLIFLILWSGGGFTYSLFPYWMFVSVILVGFIFRCGKYKIYKNEWLIIGIVASIFLIQMFLFGGNIKTLISPLFVIFNSCMTANMLRSKFPKMIVFIMLFFACASLLLWVIDIVPIGHKMLLGFSKSFPQLGWEILKETEGSSAEGYTMFLYTVVEESNYFLPRNFGPFWEPGRFVIFLNIAFMINLFHQKKSIFSKSNIIFIVAILSTLSTTGYTALYVILTSFIIHSKISKTKKIFMALFLLILTAYSWNLEFMSEKINLQYNEIDQSFSRFGAMVYHWQQIQKSPIIGYGPFIKLSGLEMKISPNGITDLARYFGVPMSIILFIMLYKGNKVYVNRSNYTRLMAFLVVLILCFSQTITYSPFFYLLYFFACVPQKQRIIYGLSNN